VCGLGLPLVRRYLLCGVNRIAYEQFLDRGKRQATSRAGAASEQHDEWTEGRRYLGLDVLARSRVTLAAGSTDPQEVTPASDFQALSA
jgi:hypothetical protein